MFLIEWEIWKLNSVFWILVVLESNLSHINFFTEHPDTNTKTFRPWNMKWMQYRRRSAKLSTEKYLSIFRNWPKLKNICFNLNKLFDIVLFEFSIFLSHRSHHHFQSTSAKSTKRRSEKKSLIFSRFLEYTQNKKLLILIMFYDMCSKFINIIFKDGIYLSLPSWTRTSTR